MSKDETEIEATIQAKGLTRQAGDWEKQATPVRAECARQAARHMEELQAAKDALAQPWKRMQTAPQDGAAVLALLDGADVAHAVREDSRTYK